MSSTKGGKARYKVKHGGGGGAGANAHKSQLNTSSTEADDDDVTEPTTVVVDPATTTTTTTSSSSTTSSSKTNGDGDHEANGDADTESANGTNSSNSNSNGIMANLNHVPTPKNATKKRQPSSSGLSTTHVEIQGSVPEKVSGFEQLAEQLARGGVANPTLAAAALMSGGSLSGSTGNFDMSVISGVVPTAATASGSSLQTNNSSLAHSNLVAANSSAVYTSTSNSSTSVGSVSSSSSSSYSLNSSLPSSASTLVTLPDLSSFSEADRQRIASIQQKLKEKYKNMHGEAADAEVEKLTAALVEELTRSAVQGANGDSAVPAPSTTGESPSRLLVGASFVAVATMTSVLFAAELAKTIVRRGR